MFKMLRSLALLVAVFCALVSGPASAQTAFRLFPDSSDKYVAYLRIPPTYVDVRVLGAGVNEDHTLPAGARYVIFSSNCADFYAKRGGAAAVPAADVTNGSASELNPSGYFVAGVTTLGLIAPTSCIVTISVYN